MMPIESPPEREPRRAHFVIAQSDAPQPWHVRVVGANGEPVLSGENLANEADARAVVLMCARMFGAADPIVVRRAEDATRGLVIGGQRSVEVLYVDERAGDES